MNRIKTMLVTFAITAILSSMTVMAATPHLISFQGFVVDKSTGDPLTSGHLGVEIYTTETGGTPYWSNTYGSAISDGLFDVLLGSSVALNLDITQKYWLEVYVNGEEVVGETYGGRQEFWPGSGDHTHTHVAEDITGGTLTVNNVECTSCIDSGDIDSSEVQERVSDNCPPGESIRTISDTGSVTCEIDTDTQLSEAQVDTYVANNGYLTSETDPTVIASVKDGVDWTELSGIPADIADGDDDTTYTFSCTPASYTGGALVYDVSVSCSSGTVTGGGCHVAAGNIKTSRPSGNGWQCIANAGSITVYAMCCSLS